MVKRWYVVQSKSKQEEVAFEHLKNQNYEVFLPQLTETKKLRGKMTTQALPLFPSYLFVQFDVKRNKWRSIMGTRGVRSLLGLSSDNASPLPKGFVEDLIKQADKHGFLSEKQADKVILKYTVGDRVRIQDGIFSGLSGACKKINGDFTTVLLTLLSGQFEIKLPLNLVEKA